MPGKPVKLPVLSEKTLAELLQPVRLKIPAMAPAAEKTPDEPAAAPPMPSASATLTIRCTITSKDKFRLIKALDADLVAVLFASEFPGLAA